MDWDWLRRDSLIKCASAIGHRAGAEEGAEGRKRRRGCPSCIIQEKPGGE